MARRRNGEGSIVRRKDGRWQGSLQVNGSRRTVYARTQREVRARLDELRALAARDGMLTAEGRHTLRELVEAWLDTATNIRQTTKDNIYRKYASLYLYPALGDVRIERITPDRLERLYATLTPSQAQMAHKILHRAYAVAVRWRWVAENPAARAQRPIYRARRRPLWDTRQLTAFIERASASHHYALFLLLITTGLRLGEALALTWADVDTAAALVTVRGTLVLDHGHRRVNPPKSADSQRTIAIPRETADALEEQRRLQAAWRQYAGRRWRETGFVFTGNTGSSMPHATPAKALRVWCMELGLPRMTPHDLRHLHASLLISAGVPVTAVSARLGHASPDTTLRVYAHVLSGQDAAAAEAIRGTLWVEEQPDAPDLPRALKELRRIDEHWRMPDGVA